MLETIDNSMIEAGLEVEDDVLGMFYEQNQDEGLIRKKLTWEELKPLRDHFLILKEEPGFKLFQEHCILPFIKKPYTRTDNNLDPQRALVEIEVQKALFAVMREFRKICNAKEPDQKS